MRIGYVGRGLSDDGLTDDGEELYSLARASLDAGHEAYLIGAPPAAGPAGRGEPVHVPLAAARADHHYLTGSLGYADRVYDTLRGLPLDTVEFVGTGAAAFTTIRARRLLGEFAGTRLVLGRASGPPPGSEPPASLAEMVDRHLAGYCRRYADAAPVAPATIAEPPLVSVVIPIRDQGRYLGAAIDSARRCGYRPLEIVVVDDGSTEPETLAVLDGLTGVVLRRQANRGLPAARNAGIAVARGDFVVPLDADDELPPGFVGPAVHALGRDPELGAVGGSVRNVGLLDHVGVPVGYVPDLSLVVNTFGRATAVLRATALGAVGGYDESLPAYEDWDLYLRLHKAGWGV